MNQKEMKVISVLWRWEEWVSKETRNDFQSAPVSRSRVPYLLGIVCSCSDGVSYVEHPDLVLNRYNGGSVKAYCGKCGASVSCTFKQLEELDPS